MKKQIEYALYKGDKFIDIGTKEYLANKLGVQPRTIQFYSYPSNIKRISNKNKKYAERYITIKLEN